MHQPRLADYGMLLFLGLVWGSSFPFIVAVKSIPPLMLAALRCLIGALVLLVAVRAMGLAIPREPRAEDPPWTAYVALGVILFGIAVTISRPRPMAAPAP